MAHCSVREYVHDMYAHQILIVMYVSVLVDLYTGSL